MITYIQKAGWFIGLVLLQVLILDNVHIGGYATPFLYIYFLLKLDAGTSRNALLLWGFILGLVVDVFSNTPGINAAATVFLAFMRTPYLRLFTPRENMDAAIIPSIKAMGFASFLKYIILAVLSHHLVLFLLAFYSFADPLTLTLKIISSTVLSISCIIAFDSVRK